MDIMKAYYHAKRKGFLRTLEMVEYILLVSLEFENPSLLKDAERTLIEAGEELGNIFEVFGEQEDLKQQFLETYNDYVFILRLLKNIEEKTEELKCESFHWEEEVSRDLRVMEIKRA